jgi:hypothetical protein
VDLWKSNPLKNLCLSDLSSIDPHYSQIFHSAIFAVLRTSQTSVETL